MPTAPKLVAALCFAFVGFFTAESYLRGLLLRDQAALAFDGMAYVMAGIGALCGWRIMGRLTGKGWAAAVGTGLRTAVTTVFWALLVYAIQRMIKKALQRLYGDSPMEAVVDVFALMLDYALQLAQPEVIAALVIGGALGGIASEYAGRRWL
jgi:hypothetical protein